MSYAAQAGRQSVASNQATQHARLLILGPSPRIALAEQEFNLGKLPSREGVRKEGQGEKKRQHHHKHHHPQKNQHRPSNSTKSEPASGDVTTTARLPPSWSPPPSTPPSSPEDPTRAAIPRNRIHTTWWHTRGLIPPGYCNGCHPRHATVPRQTLEHQGASSFVLRHDLYASLVARRTFHMTHNRPIPLPTSCPLQHAWTPQGPRS